MVRYLLVDGSDGRVLAELAGARQAARELLRYARDLHGARPLSVVRLDHHQGSLVDITSTVSMGPPAARITTGVEQVRSRLVHARGDCSAPSGRLPVT